MTTGKHRFENLDCPVEAGEDCVMPPKWRVHDTSFAVFIAGIILSLLLWAGGPSGVNSHFSSHDEAIKQNQKDIDFLRESDKQIRQETRDEVKAINEKLDRLIERRR